MSLTHHLIIRTAINRVGSGKYILLGDDIVISGKDASSEYMSICKSLGMEFSKFKSLESNTSFEFAKRFFTNKVESSPFPIGQLKHSSNTY